MEKERSYPVREPPPPKPKRVYKSVAVGEGAGGAYAVLLDGKPGLTPLRTHLATSSRALAEAVALARRYASPEAASFVNGILSAAARARGRGH